MSAQATVHSVEALQESRVVLALYGAVNWLNRLIDALEANLRVQPLAGPGSEF